MEQNKDYDDSEKSQNYNSDEEILEESGFKCVFCFEMLNSIENVKDHMRNIHSEIYDISDSEKENSKTLEPAGKSIV